MLFVRLAVDGRPAEAAGPDSSANAAVAERPRDAFLLQYGETVLAIGDAAADAPRQRRQEDPWIKIVSLKPGDRRLLMELSIVQGKPEWFSVVLKSASGRSVSAVRGESVAHPHFQDFNKSKPGSRVTFNSDGSQQIELPNVGERVEAWIEYEPGQPYRLPGFGGEASAGIKISKSVTLGPVGQLTWSRNWTVDEKEAAEKLRLETASPPPPPDGYVIITERTKPLVPGMPILIVESGRWAASELLSVQPRRLFVKRLFRSQLVSAPIDRARCAVSSQVLEEAESDASKFKPSLRVLETSGIVLPEGFEPVTPSMALVQGMSVFYGRRPDSMFAGSAPDGKINVRDRTGLGTLQTIDRSAAAVRTSDVAKLSDPAFAAEAQARYRAFLRLLDREADLKQEAQEVHEMIESSVRPPEKANVGDHRQPAGPPVGTTPLTAAEFLPASLPVLFRDGTQWRVAIVREDSPEGRADVRITWPYAGQEVRAARKDLYVRSGLMNGESDHRGLVSDASPRPYTFFIGAERLPLEARQVLTQGLGVDISEPALRDQPFQMEVKTVKTSLEAKTLEYRLLASGTGVSVERTKRDSK